MKKIVPSLLALFLMGSVAFATLFDVTFDRDNFSSTLGTIAKTSDGTGSGAGASADVTYEVTGLTIDAVGTFNDSLTFTVTLAVASSGGVNGMGFSSGDWGVNTTVGTDTASLFDFAGETMTLTFASSSVLLNGATAGVVSSQGFTGFNVTSLGGSDSFDLSGGTSADGVGLTADPSFLLTPTFTLGFNTGGVRIGDIEATFDVNALPVPEPSAFALLVIGILGLVSFRHRRM